MTAAVAVVSGGMDSVTLAYLMKARGDLPHGHVGWNVTDLTIVSVNYGQRHARELFAAHDAAARLDAEYVAIDLSSVGRALAGSSLTDRAVDVPEGHYAEDTMRATVVPNRNAILASVAYGVALSRHAHVVALGVHAGDHTIYPDCRPQFVTVLNMAFEVGSRWSDDDKPPVLAAPFVNMSKADIVQLGDALRVPYADTWSCYQGGHIHCGKCGTCVERAEAFDRAGVADPTTYADPDYWRTVAAR